MSHTDADWRIRSHEFYKDTLGVLRVAIRYFDDQEEDRPATRLEALLSETPRGDTAKEERDRDWILAMGYALGTDSGHKVPIVPKVEVFKEFFAALRSNGGSAKVPEGYEPISQNDKRWRLLEHGCQWVSWTPTGGDTVSFDPRDVKFLKAMRQKADETIEEHLKLLRGLMKEHGGVEVAPSNGKEKK